MAKRCKSAPPPSAKAEPARKRTTKRDVAGIAKVSPRRAADSSRVSRRSSPAKKEIDPAIFEQIEEVLLTSDVGVKTTQAILERLRDALAKNELADSDAVWDALRAEATRILRHRAARRGRTSHDKADRRADGRRERRRQDDDDRQARDEAESRREEGHARRGRHVPRRRRAAARSVGQARRARRSCKGKDGADPGAVAFDATTKAAADASCDVLFVDTAGRLHTKAPLMDEIKKVRKTIDKAMDGAPHETLLVLDATTGQNALKQAALFKDALDLTGIVLTKLDGTAKGGIVLAICDELKIPVRYIGLGERAEDLREFYADEFVEALFSREEDQSRGHNVTQASAALRAPERSDEPRRRMPRKRAQRVNAE